MKKVLLVLTILLTLGLSGCGEYRYTNEEVDELLEMQYNDVLSMVESNYYNDDITYTDDEVDELIEESARYQENLYEEYFVFYEESNGLLYAQCQDASGYEECYVELDYRPLEEDITTLEDEIAIATIAMLDILIYQYENTIENPTEADIAMYNLLLMQRLELEGEIE
jgi:hypothetical protein